MRHIHPAAWGGLLLNSMLTFVLLSGLNALSPSDLPPMDQTILKALELLRPIMLLLLGLQAVALGLIASKSKIGIVLAGIASFFMMPAGLVYFLGCILSHCRWKYADFESITAYSHSEASFPSAPAAKLPILTIGTFAVSILCFISGIADLGGIFFCLSLAGVYLSIRARKFHALSLHQGYFTVTPGIFVDPLAIAYSSVREATLNDDDSIRFSIDSSKGTPLVLAWSLLRVEKNNRRAALETLGAALTAHHVPLY